MAGRDSSLLLDIVAQTPSNDGQCFMGLSEDNRLLRPVFTTQPNKCCWPKDSLRVGNRYRFSRHPRVSITPYPHKNEDALVHKEVENLGMAPDLYSRLASLAYEVSEIAHVFPLGEPLRTFVNAGVNCPSVAVFRSHTSNVHLLGFEGKPRLCIEDRATDTELTFPMTAIDYDDMCHHCNTEVLVMLGLGRPWSRRQDNGEKCYVLVLNLFRKQ